VGVRVTARQVEPHFGMTMHTRQDSSSPLIALLLGIVVCSMAGFASADPPTRVARLGYLDGPVSFSPAGENEWVAAPLNRPLVTGDRLWADAGARVELQIGGTAIRLGGATSVTLLNLDDRVAQVQLAQGTLNIRVRYLDPDQVVEIDTPNLAYAILRPGQYRISVDPDGNATEVRTGAGQAEAYGEGATYLVDAGRAYRFFGTGLRDYEILAFPAIDEFERWALQRDRGFDNSISARYVSRDVIGYQDLDAYGTWRAVPEYGNVWVPTRVRADWVPYRDGHWAWIEPWGWTWVDDAPWGFAVSHYGRWAYLGGSWGWIPGPAVARAVYAPALVAFIGGSNFQVAIASGGAVGWFPLGPRDVYRPGYSVSRNYFTNVNVSNTTINNTYVTNVYNNTNVTNVTYANQHVRGAVVSVPTTAFAQSQPVARTALQLPHDQMMRAPVNTVAAVAPTRTSVLGTASRGTPPPPQALERPVVARRAPPAAPIGFAAKERALAGNPGRPIDAPALAGLRTATPVAAPKVEVIVPSRNAGPAVAPPPQTNPRSKGEQAAPPQPGVPPATRPQPTPAAPPTGQPPQRGPGLQQGGPSATPPGSESASPPQRGAAAPPQGAPSLPPQGTPPTPPQAGRKVEQGSPPVNPPASMRPPQANGPAPTPVLPEPRGRPETRGQPSTPAPVAPPPAVARPPQTTAPAPAPVQVAPEQRNKPDVLNQPRPPAPAATPPVPPAPQEQQRARPESTAAPRPMPPPGVPPAPASAAPPVSRQAGAPPPSAPPAKVEQRRNEPRPAGDKKVDEPPKGDEDPKRR
jgi:hypothetical protein